MFFLRSFQKDGRNEKYNFDQVQVNHTSPGDYGGLHWQTER
jgi:dTDP-4-dehydrorhamnose 3,5-epimerase-like enzyme